MNALNTQISCVNAGLKLTNRKRSHVWTATTKLLPIAADASFRGITDTVTRTYGRRFWVVESGLNGILLKIDIERNVLE